MKKLFCFLLVVITISCSKKKEPVEYVNTRIGNISHLLVPTYPTTHLPNSMIRMIPGQSEYITDRKGGLPLNVPSHRQSEVLVLKPFSGKASDMNVDMDYSYDMEYSTPYYYSVLFDDYNIKAEFAPSAKAAIFRFTYNDTNSEPVLMLACKNKSEIEIKDNIISGYELFNGIKHYFYLELDEKPASSEIIKQGAIVSFPKETKDVNVRYGVSYIDCDQAKINLQKDLGKASLESVSNKARGIWNKTLGQIEIEGGSEDQKTTFYTALYRCYERMVNISEDGRYYSAYDNKVHNDDGVDFWVDDWVWDTYVALHPLQIILNPEKQKDKLTSYIRMYEQSGWMPTFPAVSGDLHCMNGNHAASVFADALCKGIPFDTLKAMEGMKNTVLTETMIPWIRAKKTELDDFYHQNGWFPALAEDDEETNKLVGWFEKRQAVAVTLAASYDDWCISKLANAVNDKKTADYFFDRSYNYRKLFNKETGFFHPKDSLGNFIKPFDYIFSGGIGARAYYDENNAWTYIWDVRHNIPDLIELFGSKDKFISKLDSLFIQGMTKSKWQYYALHPDASGSVGQFVMGNEPSFHIPYLYNYAGEPWKAQKRLRMLMDSWFRNDLMGICGDEDGGGMSAFYVFSAMGFYPVTPGIPEYSIGSSIFDKVVINLSNGKKFTIKTVNNSRDNKYIISAKLNGIELNKTQFTHNDIINGGTIEFIMGDRPNKNWGK